MGGISSPAEDILPSKGRLCPVTDSAVNTCM
jgi:hypothetical protein